MPRPNRQSTYRPRHRDMIPRSVFMERRDHYTRLSEMAEYKGKSYHKSRPGDFGLSPPCDPRSDKTLCDSAGIRTRAEADGLLKKAFAHGLVSVTTVTDAGGRAWPKHIWAVTEAGAPVEAVYCRDVGYCGYPIPDKRTALFDEILARWPQTAE